VIAKVVSGELEGTWKETVVITLRPVDVIKLNSNFHLDDEISGVRADRLSVETLQNVETIQTVQTVETLHTVETVQNLQSVQSVQTLYTVQTAETLHTVKNL
jgi:inorganic pyrophosphatase